MPQRPAGVLVPITTPFDATTGDVSAVALRSNARALLGAGVTGLLVAGSTGEAAMLGDEEVRRMVAWLREVVPDHGCLMVGTGRESTRATIDACRTAGDEGADAVLVRPPAYFASALTQGALTDHFRAVADASPVPVLLYNIPKYTHLAVAEAVLVALADHENVWGAKDSSGDLKNFAAYRDAVPSWTLLVGSGALLYAAMELGAAGGILGVANFAADTAVSIAAAYARGDRGAAGAAQERLTPLHREIVAQLGPAGVKAAMDEVGLVGGPVRPPLPAVDDRQRRIVVDVLAQASLLPA